MTGSVLWLNPRVLFHVLLFPGLPKNSENPHMIYNFLFVMFDSLNQPVLLPWMPLKSNLPSKISVSFYQFTWLSVCKQRNFVLTGRSIHNSYPFYPRTPTTHATQQILPLLYYCSQSALTATNPINTITRLRHHLATSHLQADTVIAL